MNVQHDQRLAVTRDKRQFHPTHFQTMGPATEIGTNFFSFIVSGEIKETPGGSRMFTRNKSSSLS
ncbi:MAG: hypothetical protein JRN35_00970 [Nitrososphaerota archaeon]|nr:hypothetical protein [Nitrososphaerota archaeon]MDG7030800.1 hypothetical protein [Nitrososphaerota archaeon]